MSAEVGLPDFSHPPLQPTKRAIVKLLYDMAKAHRYDEPTGELVWMMREQSAMWCLHAAAALERELPGTWCS